MKVLIIEDEQHAAEALEAIILKLRPEAKVLAQLGAVEEAVEWLRLHQAPELIFCDIYLSDGNSFEIFRQIEVKCPVIFTTAYNQYAIEAFQVNSIDYLLKPIKTDEVAKSLRKYEELQQQHMVQKLESLQNLLGSPQVQSARERSAKTRFMVKSGQSIKAISSEDIAYFLAEEGVVFLVTYEGKRFVVNYTLDQLEELLDIDFFFRANRQLFVHINSIKEVRPYFKGRLLLLLQPDAKTEIVISSSKASAFKDWLDL
jgi:two-component system response regulator LytT